MPRSRRSSSNASATSSDPDVELALRLSGRQAADVWFDWRNWARSSQLEPSGDWTTWLLMGGRGSGKTRAGAEWVREQAAAGVTPIALVGETMAEAIAVMIDGESGLMRISPDDERPRRRGAALTWPNGVTGTILPANDPERFRGPQFAAAWCDEIGKWPNAEAAWDMLQFGMRLGARPRQVATTTPRPTPLIKRLIAEPGTAVTRMKTEENAKNLAPDFLDAVVGHYRGTVLGRQELDGELIEDMPGALWTRDLFRRATNAPMSRIVVAVDPPAKGGPHSDAAGIVIAGRQGEGAVVLEDRTIKPAPPMAWARRAVRAFEDYKADLIVAEANQGGDLVRAMIGQVDPNVPVKLVHATRGKWVRAEPVAALYARELVTHRAGLGALEDEMCLFGIDGLADGRSPDRVDALVWALTELMLNEMAVPRVRGF